MNDLHGKVAIVTGASKGIGAGIARAMGTAGADVAVNYASNCGDADRVVTEIVNQGGKACRSRRRLGGGGCQANRGRGDRCVRTASHPCQQCGLLHHRTAGAHYRGRLSSSRQCQRAWRNLDDAGGRETLRRLRLRDQYRLRRCFSPNARFNALFGDEGRIGYDHPGLVEGTGPSAHTGQFNLARCHRHRGQSPRELIYRRQAPRSCQRYQAATFLPQSFVVARRAPSTIASSFTQPISCGMRPPPMPQSVLAMTFSRPAHLVNF